MTNELGLGLRGGLTDALTARIGRDNGAFYDAMGCLARPQVGGWKIQWLSYGRWGGLIPTEDIATSIQHSFGDW